MFGIAFAPAWLRAGAFILVSALLSASGAIAADRRPVAAKMASAYDQRAEVTKFIDDMVERHGFVRSELQSLFRKTVFQPVVVKAISPPKDPRVRSWSNYRAIFVNAQRISAGQQFMVQHAEALARARAEFGVPEEIIAAIIGVETVYGRNMGNFRIVDALTTLAFDYPPRAEYFRSELEHYLLYTRDAGVDVFSLRGSYAGAYGLPQFMPASLRRYAVDYDGDAKANLGRSVADGIGSVGNFLKGHGWKPGNPIAFPVTLEGEGFRKFADGSVKPAWPLAELNAAGVTTLAPAEALSPDTLAVLVELDTPDQPSEYRVALDNFYVITRYNRSSFYAAAVMDLAAALRGGAAVSEARPD
jgi:membrane-bound lytic murein transglycosylase B